MGEAEDQAMGERRSLQQGSLELYEYRLKQLEDARLTHRMQVAENAISQVQVEIKAITELTRAFSGKLDSAVQTLNEKQDAESKKHNDAQVKFMSFVKGALWIGGAIAAVLGFFVSFAEPLSKIFMVLAATPGAGG